MMEFHLHESKFGKVYNLMIIYYALKNISYLLSWNWHITTKERMKMHLFPYLITN